MTKTPIADAAYADDSFDIVDAHHHLFDLTRADYGWLKPGDMHRFGPIDPICKNYLPADYLADLAPHRIVADVHVEGHRDHHHHPLEETRWLAELKGQTGVPTVCVAGACLHREDAAEVLAAQAAFPFVRGIRETPKNPHLPDGAPQIGYAYMTDPHWRDGFALLERHGFSCDLLALDYRQLDDVAQLARDFPRTTIVVNHLAYPPADLDPQRMDAWRKSLQPIAREPNVFMKVSGMCLGGVPWREENHAAAVQHAMRVFGAERCIFGSNFPVDRLTGSFDTIVRGIRSIVADLSANEQRQLFRDTAVGVYRITEFAAARTR